jgi:hypothetical protein
MGKVAAMCTVYLFAILLSLVCCQSIMDQLLTLLYFSLIVYVQFTYCTIILFLYNYTSEVCTNIYIIPLSKWMSVWTHSMTELTYVDIWFTMLSSYFVYPKTITMFCGIIYTIEISYYSTDKMDGRSNARHQWSI